MVKKSKSMEDLRKHAEKLITSEPGSMSEEQNLVHELQVHQIELELQNEELRRSHLELDLLRERYFDLYDLAPVGYMVVTKNGLVMEANLTAASLLGTSREDMLQKQFARFIGTNFQDQHYLNINQLFKTGETRTWEIQMKRTDGSMFWGRFEAAVSKNEEGSLCYRVILSDITRKKEFEEEIVYLSYHDYLTGIYNRRYYENQLKKIDHPANLPVTIVMGDVNGLKMINDSFGHVAGDEVLIKAATKLKNIFRPDDIVARLGGDEFVVILPKTDNQEALNLIEKAKLLTMDDMVESIGVSVSFGCATKTKESENMDVILKNAEDDMYRHKLYESSGMKSNIVNTIISTLYEKNKREEQHSQRVSDLCVKISTAMGMPRDKIEEIKSAGMLHDIGKIAIDDNLLNKQGKLNNSESIDIKRHPEIGFRILSAVNEMSEMSEYVLAHHERWDGKGYPKGLSGTDIPLQSRIIAVSDSFDAMVNNRTYGKMLTNDEAIVEIKKNAGSQFDPAIVTILIDLFMQNKL